MKNKNKILLAILISIIVFSGLTTKAHLNKNKYLQLLVDNVQNKDLIKASGQLSGGTPFVTISVEHITTNHLPNIIGTCSVGDEMTFIVKTGSTYSTISETITKLCDVSPYNLTPTILVPDGKYRVDVSISTPIILN